ncbi:MAG: DUF393 domain-containing protein [Planctomycetota bacterium]
MSSADTQPVFSQKTADRPANQDGPTAEPTHGLPSPREFPNADVVIYDGRCVFCVGQVRNLHWFDGKNRLAFISLHDPWVAEHFPELSYDQLMEQIYLVPASEHGYSEQRLGGMQAVRFVTRRLPKLWIFAPLLHIPFTLPLWQWAYMQVAKRRYKIAGKQGGPECDENGTCEVHFGDKK